MTERDAAAGVVVGRELDLDPVARENADLVLPHFPGDRGENRVSFIELHPEHRTRERLDDLAFDLDLLFLGRQIPFSGAGLRRGHAHGSAVCASGSS